MQFGNRRFGDARRLAWSDIHLECCAPLLTARGGHRLTEPVREGVKDAGLLGVLVL